MNTQPRDDPFVQHLTERLDRLAEQAGSADTSVAAAGPADDGDRVSAVVTQLRTASTWTEPPADLRATVLARVLAAPEVGAAAGLEPPAGDTEGLAGDTEEPSEPESQPQPEGRPEPLAQPLDLAAARRRRSRWTIPITAVAAVTVTFSVLAVERALEGGPQGESYVAAGTELAPEAGAKVSVASAAAGFSIVIDAHDLPAAAAGSYYVAWLRGPRGIVPIGSLHARKSGRPITMWSGVDPAAYPQFSLTLQREGEPVSTPSRFVVLTANLTGS